ncbi:unnamed protein product [Timema podura]|uniref:MADF domain-containing protein n=1 Tax=Timema podura TaxID=61482 RepID=A0ABN7NPM5_TIMPD|nr:unnamed protein product [Timema podura]
MYPHLRRSRAENQLGKSPFCTPGRDSNPDLPVTDCSFVFYNMSAKDEFLTEFNKQYKSFPCLWRESKVKNIVTAMLNHRHTTIIEKRKIVDPEAAGDTVVKKINTLRTAYRKELKKVVDSEKSDAGEEDIYVPHLWYYELMNFIRDQEISRESRSNLNELEGANGKPMSPRPRSSSPVTFISSQNTCTSSKNIKDDLRRPVMSSGKRRTTEEMEKS